MAPGLFRGFPLEEAIAGRAAACGIDLSPAWARALAEHARAVADADPRLHLTAIVEPREFIERHLGEAFEGAALLDAGIQGVMVDLGSGNGYPGLPLAAARRGLRPVLAEASRRKAAFLRGVLAPERFGGGEVLEGHVQRARDLEAIAPVRVLATRAAGSWEKIVPRLVTALDDGGRVLVWAGGAMESLRTRASWRSLELVSRRALPGRGRSWVWLFRKPGFSD